MAYDPHTLVTFGGRLREISAGDEIWQCGVRGVNEPGDGPVGNAQLTDLVQAIATQVGPTQNLLGWFQMLDSYMANSATLEWVKAANIGPDGKYTAPPAVYTYAVPGAGPSAGTAPSFMSVCLSWRTGRNYGRKLRNGRIYPPNYATPYTAGSAVIGGGTTASLVGSAKKLLSALAQSGDEFNFVPCVVSPVGGHERITGVRVGNVYDVHRSRKNAVQETYATGVWP